MSGETRASFDQMKLQAVKKVIQSRHALQFLERRILRNLENHPANRIVAQFGTDLIRRLYADSDSKIVWTNIFFPSELLWGLGLIPFFPEIAAVAGAGIGLSDGAIARATADAYAVDLCTVHRAAVGFALEKIFPRTDAVVATSHLCDISGQNLANHAYQNRRPFFFVDVPASTDEAAVEYVAKQLELTSRELCAALDVRFDLDGIRKAIRYSNCAREAALEQITLRAARPAPLRGSGMIAQLGLTAMLFGTPWGVDYHRALREYVRSRVSGHMSEQTNQKTRVYWMHLRPYFSTDLITHVEDDLGVVIAFEESSEIWWEQLNEERPWNALARKMLANFMLGPIERRIDKALANVERFACDGVIHFNHWGCRQSTGSLRLLRDRLKREGIPFLQIDGDCVDPANLQMGPLRTRIEAFVETISQ